MTPRAQSKNSTPYSATPSPYEIMELVAGLQGKAGACARVGQPIVVLSSDTHCASRSWSAFRLVAGMVHCS
jgi:hypothetical protein